MKIFTAAQIREWDQYTIREEPVPSIELMERAARQCADWLSIHLSSNQIFHIFCAKGNNGGDGLAIARILSQRHLQVAVHILEFGHKGTNDFQANLARLHQIPEVPIRFIQSEEHFQVLDEDCVIIDALFGSGLNRSLEGITLKLVEHINRSHSPIISIDIPSGLFTDRSSRSTTGSAMNTVIKASHTLTFQCYKPAFLAAENADYIGQLHILDIGLQEEYYNNTSTDFELVDKSLIKNIYQPRNAFGHKGSFGHALIAVGSYGKMGAAILCGKACLRSGVGLLTYHIPQGGYAIMQNSVPEAMVMTDFNNSFLTGIDISLDKFDAIGIGPGIGTASETASVVKSVLNNSKVPIVIDADALNNIAQHPEWLKELPEGSILTPHPKEFERLFGKTENEFARIELAIEKAKELKVVIVLKGHHTLIATPKGKAYFNSTGNAGMATGGTGDVLTGILTGLLAQGYLPINAAILGVYLHGLAGDLAAKEISQEAMVAGDVVDYLGKAFLKL